MLVGTLIGMIQQDEIGGKGGLLEKRDQRGTGSSAQGHRLALHQSTESSSTVNMGMQSMGADAEKVGKCGKGSLEKFTLLKISQ